MPKEYISTEPQERGSIKVTWGRDHGVVQIAVAGPIGWRSEVSQGRIPLVMPVDADNGLDWYYSPTRGEINNLIRTLRRARDQAFGADE